jgi:hypothetical protein
MRNITVTIPDDDYRRVRIWAVERDTFVSAIAIIGTRAGFGTQWVSFDPRPPPRVFKGLHGANVKAIIKS